MPNFIDKEKAKNALLRNKEKIIKIIQKHKTNIDNKNADTLLINELERLEKRDMEIKNIIVNARRKRGISVDELEVYKKLVDRIYGMLN